MKHINIILLITLCTTFVFTTAEAQRRGMGNAEGRNRESRPSNISPSRGESANVRSFPDAQRTEHRDYNNSSARPERNSVTRDNRNTPQRSFQDNRLTTTTDRNNYQSSNQRNSVISTDNTARVIRERNTNLNQTPVRNTQGTSVSPQSNSRTFDQQRNNRNVVASNNAFRNNSYNGYRNSNYRDRDNYRNSYYSYNRNGGGRRFYVMYGPRYSYRPYNSVSIYFGGFPYYYSSGLYYGYYGGYYQPVFPPFGIRIATLPFGYSRFYMGVDPFYYYNGIYYRQYDNSYEVVDAPMGATVSSLPTGAKSVSINGEKFYELNGTYYKEDRNSKGRTVYVVVGKNGEINNSNEGNNSDYSASPLNNGDIVPELPEGSKVITLNGEKLYVTPDDTYLKEERNGDILQYRVVGK